jgi:NAD dependent epimerase/dehydratase family enzyme
MPNGIPAPALLLEITALFMRTESELVLKSRNVIPARLLREGFEFEFPTWAEAAKDLVRQHRLRD